MYATYKTMRDAHLGTGECYYTCSYEKLPHVIQVSYSKTSMLSMSQWMFTINTNKTKKNEKKGTYKRNRFNFFPVPKVLIKVYPVIICLKTTRDTTRLPLA